MSSSRGGQISVRINLIGLQIIRVRKKIIWIQFEFIIWFDPKVVWIVSKVLCHIGFVRALTSSDFRKPNSITIQSNPVGVFICIRSELNLLNQVRSGLVGLSAHLIFFNLDLWQIYNGFPSISIDLCLFFKMFYFYSLFLYIQNS